MFTGIIEAVGAVKNIFSGRLEVSAFFDGVKRGDSIAVDGVCLTVSSIGKGIISFDFSPRTASLTTLAELRAGDKVNLERAMSAAARFGGHIVSGHADGVAKICGIEEIKNFYKFTFLIKQELEKYLPSGASVALDGISLTVDKISAGKLSVIVIPETFENTALHYKKTGGFVNIETDILAKYAAGASQENITENFLKEHGFI